MNKGKLRGVRIYDNGGPDVEGGSNDRYTVCYPAYRLSPTARDIGNGWLSATHSYSYVCMSGAPFWPQGICQHGEHWQPIDRPRYRHLGKRIQFAALPTDCQRVVRRDLQEA